nr:FAD-dependent monooxygenase [Streptomyces spinoverrucosus]
MTVRFAEGTGGCAGQGTDGARADTGQGAGGLRADTGQGTEGRAGQSTDGARADTGQGTEGRAGQSTDGARADTGRGAGDARADARRGPDDASADARLDADGTRADTGRPTDAETRGRHAEARAHHATAANPTLRASHPEAAALTPRASHATAATPTPRTRHPETATTPTLRARYVIAADGGRSVLRRALGIDMTGETVDPSPMLVADVRISGLDRDNWHIFPPRENGDFLAICPLASTDDFQLVASFPEGTSPDLSLDGIRKLVAARSHLSPDDVTEVRWASDFRLRAALADRFRAGRVFLAGDAAHVHSPAGGQGLNTSVQDAYNLGWKLGAVLRGHAPATLLDTYEEERRPIAAHMLGLSTGVHRGEVRRGAATRQLGLGHRGSSLTKETRTRIGAGLRAGDRAPDGIAGDVRLFDAFRGPHWTLLAVGTDTELPALPIPTLRIKAYEPYGTGVFLIRPDGYVGWAGETGAGLAEYAARTGVAEAIR